MQTNLKGYEIVEHIKASGFGTVYRAKQISVDREVAIKFILPIHANHPDFIRRFEMEALTIARLQHPHITPLLDYWRDPQGACLVMRYLEGGSVRDALSQAPYDLESTSRLLDQIASALAFAHRHDVVHRDIKPENILLDEDGNAYLADFGIAKDLKLNEGLTDPDGVVGTFDYIAPEQASSEPITPRTDIYSLGVTLYEMITGEHPFKQAGKIERLYKHMSEPLPLIDNLPDNVRDTVNDIIQKATAKDPAHRYPDVLALAIAFREAIGRSSTSQELSIIEQMTLREHEILQLIADGLSNKEIAEQLFITLSTVKWHVTQLYKKLGVRTRVQAIVRAREMNLIYTDDFTTGQVGSVSQLSLPEPENPYKGLHAFDLNDARDFFGREELIEKLLHKMKDAGRFHRFLAVVGPSGSGKSSLVKAGLIPALRNGKLPDSEKWFVVDFVPGTHPLEALELALIRVAADQATNVNEHLQRDERGLLRAAELILPRDNTELVVVIDQFEEVFTQVSDERLRQHFLKLLWIAATDKRSRVRVIVTLRADYYDKPLHYPEFGEMVKAQMETILPLNAKGLEYAITRPAERVGVTFEAGLVTQIISEMTYQAGALPLLQYALTELFDRREGRLLTHAAYQAIGGAVGALAHRAEEDFLSLSPTAQELARQVFLRLVTLGEGAEDTRRRTGRKELLSLTDDTDMLDEILDTFTSHRLLSLDNDATNREPTVEVAHEAILREWERLREWINQHRDDLRLHRRLTIATREWLEGAEDPGLLARDTRLEQFEAWAAQTDLLLNADEKCYLQISIEAQAERAKTEAARKDREVLIARRVQNFQRASGVLLIVAIIASVATSLSVVQANNAHIQQMTAQAQGAISEQRELAADTQVALAQGQLATATVVQGEVEERLATANAVGTQIAEEATLFAYRQMRVGTLAAGSVFISGNDLPQIPAVFLATETAIAQLNQWQPQVQEFDGVEMVLVPAGCFWMGSITHIDEQPVSSICFDEPFWIDRFEVTRSQYEQFGGQSSYPAGWNDPDQPRTNITWDEARDFCEISRGSGVRLPTEAEWEYTARGPDSRVYPWGNTFIDANPVWSDNFNMRPDPVGSREAGVSWVGAYDMSGNVSEWVSTIYDREKFPYPYDPDDGREDRDATNVQHGVRGGSWQETSTNYLRGATRGGVGAFEQRNIIGFRCARSY